jgi:hypothetical protein
MEEFSFRERHRPMAMRAPDGGVLRWATKGVSGPNAFAAGRCGWSVDYAVERTRRSARPEAERVEQ